MKILIAIDSFKGTLNSDELGQTLCAKLNSQHISADYVTVSDGGEGLLATLESPLHLTLLKENVLNPLGDKIDSQFGLSKDSSTLVVELALASGLPLIPESLQNPLLTTTFGCGQLLHLAKKYHCKKILLGVGGSATTDAGVGALQALDVFFEGASIPASGKDLINITKIDSYKHHWLHNIDFQIACDVNNPFTGNSGSAQIYSKQKCAPHLNSNAIMQILEKGMNHFKELIFKTTNIDLNTVPGSGAAGGIAGSMHALLGAKLISGTQILFHIIQLEEKIKNSDLIITGEGCLDQQTIHGKVVAGISQLTKKYNKNTIALCGQNKLTNSELLNLNINKTYSLTEDSALDICLRQPQIALQRTLSRLKTDLN